MSGMHPRRILLLLISALILAILILYTYAYLEVVPYIGFTVRTGSGLILEVQGDTHLAQSLQPGDVIQNIDGQGWQSYIKDRQKMLFSAYAPGDRITFVVLRDSRSETVVWQAPGRNRREVVSRLATAPWLAYSFWLFGLLAILAVGPTDVRWILMALINNLLALWVASGLTSWTHVYGSSLVLHASSWLLSAMLIHFHALFPRPLEGINKLWIWGLLYLIAGFGALSELFQLLPVGIYAQVMYLSLIGSAFLLALHAWRQAGSRREVLLLAGIMIMFVFFLIGVQMLRELSGLEWISGGGVLFMPLLPGFYFLIALRQGIGGMAALANRLISYLVFGLLALLPASLLLVYILRRSYNPEWEFLVLLMFVMVFGLAATLLFPRFRSWFERRFLGVHLPSDEMIAAYAARLGASHDLAGVTSTLKNEILPSLLVRQAALLRLGNRDADSKYRCVEPLLRLGVSEEQLPRVDDIPDLLAAAGKLRPTSSDACPWARLVLPLVYKGATIGVCLLGRREPDDEYSGQELPFLHTLMMQTALALVNVDQASLIHGLQQENIRRQDEERRRLANDLHDDVLPQLALVARRSMDSDDQFKQAYYKASQHIRDAINGLRPDTLEHFGLKVALQELAVELNERARETDTLVEVEIEGGLFRYPQEVELNLFRIVQQAANNALKHGRARRIKIHGRLEGQAIELAIEDDGSGFDANQLDLLGLLLKRHYGMLAMHERANLIGAGLEIDSSPGQGTRLRILWRANGD
jgi:signal transduction histidine kinase